MFSFLFSCLDFVWTFCCDCSFIELSCLLGKENEKHKRKRRPKKKRKIPYYKNTTNPLEQHTSASTATLTGTKSHCQMTKKLICYTTVNPEPRATMHIMETGEIDKTNPT